jgi:hypothetical protein
MYKPAALKAAPSVKGASQNQLRALDRYFIMSLLFSRGKLGPG